jgi:YVTN family beta-propeller protein
MSHHIHRTLIAAAAAASIAGCSGNSGSVTSGQPFTATPSNHASAGMRELAGPAVSGPLIVPIVPRQPNAPRGWPNGAPNRQLIFVADASSGILMYSPKTPNGSPVGSITNGVNAPAGVAVDSAGALYVTNEGNNTVTVYSQGSSTPSLTISTGISGPYGIAVDSSGEVFVSNLGTNDVTAYKAGATSPFETINFNNYGQAVGVGVDGSDNIWVACDSSNGVFEIPAGSQTVQNSGLTNLNGPIGVSIGKKNVVYVSNFAASDVNIYSNGSTTPSATITDGIEQFGPTLGGFASSGRYFQSNQALNVVGYKGLQTSSFSTLSGASSPLGVAGYPLVKK